VKDNSLEDFTATRAQIFAGQDAAQLQLVRNSFGRVEGSNKTSPIVPGPSEEALQYTAVYWRAKDGVISDNDFHLSKIEGWKQPDAVGCICLDPVSEDNWVHWSYKDFPDPYDLPNNQIRNDGKRNHIVGHYAPAKPYPYVHAKPSWLPVNAWWLEDIPAWARPIPIPEYRLRQPGMDLVRRFVGNMERAISPIQTEEGTWVPPIEVGVKDGKFVVTAEIPGVEKDDLTVRIGDGALAIEGQRNEKDRSGLQYSECGHGRFSRSISLPKGVDVSEVKAALKDGVLEIAVPWPGAKGAPRAIPIH
jgi:HSP20 family protein